MSYWTLTYDGTEKTLADWGVETIGLRQAELGIENLKLSIVEGFDTEDIFEFEQQVILKKGRTLSAGVFSGGTQWFVGDVWQTPRHLQPNTEFHGYILRGPLARLAEVMYGQPWFRAGEAALKTTHVFLNRGLRTDQQLADALNAVLASAAAAGEDPPFQIGTIDTLTAVPMREERDLACLEVAQSQLRWSPDAALWVDHSTTPPTVHCRRYANLSAVSVAVGGDKLAAANIQPRYDLQLPGVLLNFETTADVDGVAQVSYSYQKYPPSISGFERRCLVATFDLEGPKITHQTAAIETALILANHATEATRLNWWKAKLPWLASSDVSGLAIPAASVKFWASKWGNGPANWAVDAIAKRIEGTGAGMATTYWKALHALTSYAGDPANDADNWESVVTGTEQDTYYVQAEITPWASYARPRELVDGVWAKWLEDQGYTAERVFVTASATCNKSEPGGYSVWQGGHDLSVELVATDAPTGEFTSLESFEAGEAEPAGLAEFLYNTHATPHFQGSISLTEEECGGTVRPGKRLNLTGGTGRFAAMNAIVREVTEDILTGQTTVSFGPPRWLGPGDIIEWLRAWRTRRIWTNPATQDDASYAAESGAQLGKQAPSPNSSAGAGWAKKVTLAADSPSTKKIELDPTATQPHVTVTYDATGYSKLDYSGLYASNSTAGLGTCTSAGCGHQLGGQTASLSVSAISHTGGTYTFNFTPGAGLAISGGEIRLGTMGATTGIRFYSDALEIGSGGIKVKLSSGRLNLGDGTIDIDIADANGKTLSVIEEDICVNGVAKKRMILASAPY